MGASSWAYHMPYQQDIGKALEDLRQQVFRQGAYYTDSAFLDAINEEEVARGLSHEHAKVFREAIRALRSAPQPPPPQTIEELLERNAESGTHSILDMDGVSDTPDFGKVAPLTEQQLLEMFGTLQPTWEMIEPKVDEIQAMRQRWIGTYMIVYKDGVPDQLFFTGFSGD